MECQASGRVEKVPLECGSSSEGFCFRRLLRFLSQNQVFDKGGA